jgi:sec-independent protein translocase protein TatC
MKQTKTQHQEETFLSHLIELRKRIFLAAAAVLVVFLGLCIYPGISTVFDYVSKPVIEVVPKGMQANGIISPLVMPLKLTGLIAFIIALPFVLYQIWMFIAPGLYKHEKRFVLPLIITSTLLFFTGIAFCYFLVFGQAFAYMQQIAPKSVSYIPDIEKYFDFVITMILAFGTAFETPLVVIILVWLGIVKIDFFTKNRRFVWLGITVISAIITPADAVSMLMLMFPMAVLYELGIIVARVWTPKKLMDNDS